ncbi:MAG: ribosome biogenesis/translation initiation ATPase RLI [Nanoarchaeota archaeon]|nr:ribosome biogenesis/translation initiation ATPase RLI [Nanoarchaeota archaeon]
MKRIAVVERSRCNPVKCGDYLCIRLCPVNRTGHECIVKGEDKKIVIDEKLCTGCKICEHRCPYDAISVVNLPEKLKQEPIHRFGENMFELFSLPVPKKDMILGILGRNGIGKSTALGILAGELMPNLGEYTNPPSKQEIIKKYSNTLAGDYFKKLFSGELKVSFKPQRVELIPKKYSGVVGELIKKVDERLIGGELLNEFELDELLDRNISELSGGELQRFAIAACLAKDADFYFFDEPMSFLDITHRMKVAKLIKKFCEGKSVVVVEHDLTALDYISDEVQIVYGEAGVYGIFSQTKSVSRGINEYLDGYLSEDNIRFREHSIKFFDGLEGRDIYDEIALEFPGFEKSFDNFNLKTIGGSVRKGEVLGVIGANGLGKTTFLKILAGLIEPDSGEIGAVDISYKPQYLDLNIEGTVEEVLKKEAGSLYDSGWYRQNILEKLRLGKVMHNEVRTLSGGELQKVYIALTLSKKADVYVMDEPSAFVDVEDRIKVAEIIKEFIVKNEKCAIVVDHDIQFVDYLADNLLVFSGVSGENGFVEGGFEKREGMNKVLKMLDITYRRDKTSHRPRINKSGSQLDREQRVRGEYYYG